MFRTVSLSIVKSVPRRLELLDAEANSWNNVLCLGLQKKSKPKPLKPVKSHLSSNQSHCFKITGIYFFVLIMTDRKLNVSRVLEIHGAYNYITVWPKQQHCMKLAKLTFEGLRRLIMVVLPLLSRPRHRTFTSFFSPSHPANLSNSPIG